MWLFYFCALIPIAIGYAISLFNKKVSWKEWGIGAGIAILMAIIFNIIALFENTGDIETWSGRIISTTHYPEWVEEWEEMHTRQVYTGTDSEGHATYRTETYYTTEHDTHPEHWTATADFGSYQTEKQINSSYHIDMKTKFGGGIDLTSRLLSFKW